jgi:sugar lactone lactonase YvrE
MKHTLFSLLTLTLVAACAPPVPLALPAAAPDAAIVINPDVSFPEGPEWRDNALFYVAYGGNTLLKWDGAVNTVVWQQDGCGPSAAVGLPDGNFLITCYDANNLAIVSSGGETVTTIDKDSDGAGFVGPNDATVDARGGVYFSASGVWDVTAPITGRILYLNPDGEVTEVANDIHYSNGLALSPDGAKLYASEMAAQRVLWFPVNKDGTLGERYLFARLSDLLPDKAGMDIYMGPDGLKTDSQGNLYIAQFEGGRIIVVDPAGALLRTLDVPAPYVTNLSFGPDENTVFITGALDAFTAPYPGQVYQVENR